MVSQAGSFLLIRGNKRGGGDRGLCRIEGNDLSERLHHVTMIMIIDTGAIT